MVVLYIIRVFILYTGDVDSGVSWMIAYVLLEKKYGAVLCECYFILSLCLLSCLY